MVSEHEHVLPNGVRLNVVDLESATRNLAKVLHTFRHGGTEPLIFGEGASPEGVVIPFDQWLTFIDLADEAAADEHIRKVTSERLANPDRGEPVPLEEFLPPDSPERSDRD